MIDERRLFTLCPHADHAVVRTVAVPLDRLLDFFQVSTLLRRSHFLGQVAYESDGLRRLKENLYYTSAARIEAVWPKLKGRGDELACEPEKLGNAAYANKLGNGDEASGDGWRFSGRGLIQLTGRYNYTHYSKLTGLDLSDNPDLAEQGDGAAKVALSFWKEHGLNALADLNDYKAITRAINGPACLGLSERIALTDHAKQIFI